MIIFLIVGLVLVGYYVQARSFASGKPDLVLDVRTVEEWNTGHSDSAKLIPVNELESRVTEIENYKDKKVVVVCRSGNRAGTAIETLKKYGFTNLTNGGAWENYKN